MDAVLVVAALFAFCFLKRAFSYYRSGKELWGNEGAVSPTAHTPRTGNALAWSSPHMTPSYRPSRHSRSALAPAHLGASGPIAIPSLLPCCSPAPCCSLLPCSLLLPAAPCPFPKAPISTPTPSSGAKNAPSQARTKPSQRHDGLCPASRPPGLLGRGCEMVEQCNSLLVS
jgi:hypothetical protein